MGELSGVVVFARDPAVAADAREAASTVGRPCAIVGDVAELAALLRERTWSMVVLEHELADARFAAAQLEGASDRTIVWIVREPPASAVPHASAVVVRDVAGRALLEIGRPRVAQVPGAFDRLLGATLLGSSLDDAIDAAAHEIAVAFGVTRCFVSEHGEPPGAPHAEGATFDFEAWNTTTRAFRQSIAAGSTLVLPAAQEPGACDSYLGVPLATPHGNPGFVGLLATGARAFTRDERGKLHALSARLANELRWRAVHDKTADELERIVSGPGLDPLLNVWNRAGLDQVTHYYVSNARRTKQPLAAMAVRVVDLEGVNTRHGMAMGDKLLRRIADAMKPALRGEDLVGRYSGTVIAGVLHGATADDAKRVAERVHATFAERSLETPDGEIVKLDTTIGVSALLDGEDARQLLTRTARATKQAPDHVVAIVSGSTRPSGPFLAVGDSPDILMRATLGGSYRVRHEISRGGMGVVYRADDLALERPVAIKMLRPELAQNEELVQHLRREAALLARVHHPNLVQIYNFGHAHDDCYFVMELVEGESMQQAIERHRAEQTHIPIAELLLVIDQIGRALDALHERGIVHRDVKPANFIRDPFNGRSVLVDVGIAHRFGELSKQAGTPGFMAPEVVQGVPASPRSDVYGLAASLYAMATLAPPWGEGEALEIIMRQCGDPPPRASAVRPELAPMDDLLADALSFDVDKRPRSARQLATAVSRAFGTILPTKTRTRTYGSLRSPEVAGGPRTRGVVFRSVPRALGVRDVDRLREALGLEHGDLVHALDQAAPLGWESSELLVRLLASAPQHLERDATDFAREIARSAVRASFRGFFPASPATMHPDRTLSAIRGIWSRYHTWGQVAPTAVHRTETVVRISDTLKVRELCAWTSELLDSLVVLSGGRDSAVSHDACEIDGAPACTFRVTWQE